MADKIQCIVYYYMKDVVGESFDKIPEADDIMYLGFIHKYTKVKLFLMIFMRNMNNKMCITIKNSFKNLILN